MKPDDYQEWLAEKRRVRAPADFADRVMAASATCLPAWRSAGFWARAAIFTVAVVGGLGRYAIAFYLVLLG
jgi:hypothetical protein